MARTHDILILGGGLVGSALACALSGRGWRLGLVEAAPASAGAPSFDERKLALAEASLAALAALEVLPRLATPPEPIRRIHVSRAGDFGSVRLAAEDYGRVRFGGVVLARELGQALDARLATLPDLERFVPATVAAVQAAPDAAQATVTLADGDTLAARLLVAADGTRSLARPALGLGAEEHDYGQLLLVCSLATDRAPDGTAYERFTEQGPVALLPMAGGHYGAICGVASADAARVLALDDAGYADYFQQRFGWRAGRVRRVGARSAYPIRRLLATGLVGPRGVVMGNAAQTLHPIGAQGFNLGLRDALTLAEMLDAAADPGEPARLQAYAEARREDRERTIAFSDGLARATATTGLPMHLLRSLGLLALGHVPGLADPLVAGAMGYRGRVPSLARSPS